MRKVIILIMSVLCVSFVQAHPYDNMDVNYEHSLRGGTFSTPVRKGSTEHILQGRTFNVPVRKEV